MSSIFIQIPSYRDFELNKTIQSAIYNASGENKLSFGIHSCVLFEDEIFFNKNYSRWISVKYETSIAPENIGVLKSRYLANKFYNNEDYYFQIDSHMRFRKNWDIVAINMINKYINMFKIKNPLITMYPPSYSYLDDGSEQFQESNFLTRVLFTENEKQFKDTLIPTQTAHQTTAECLYTASVSAACIFTKGKFAEIEPNQKIAFWGEETLTAARAFTHGFDLVIPDDYLVWHLYESNQQYSKVRRNHTWKDFPTEWQNLVENSNKEYCDIFLNKRISHDGFGKIRDLSDYEAFSGLNFSSRKITQQDWQLY